LLLPQSKGHNLFVGIAFRELFEPEERGKIIVPAILFYCVFTDHFQKSLTLIKGFVPNLFFPVILLTGPGDKFAEGAVCKSVKTSPQKMLTGIRDYDNDMMIISVLLGVNLFLPDSPEQNLICQGFSRIR
jgi:hypothetical protein